MKNKIPKSDMDYVILYANQLRTDKSLFNQQKLLIEYQLKINKELSKKRFGTGEEFINNIRIYLKKMNKL